MNPPFHSGRKGMPEIGQAFLATAARLLKPAGNLYLVANRHLPYEARLRELFAQVQDVGGDSAFKLIRATRPRR
jgi:16S rRNA (guanine1207-N2)-methyltransferase